jgi:hypothetical protein
MATSSFDPFVGSQEECRDLLKRMAAVVWQDASPVRGVQKMYSLTMQGEDSANVLSELNDDSFRCGHRLVNVKKLPPADSKKFLVLWNERFCLKWEAEGLVWLSIPEGGRDWVWRRRHLLNGKVHSGPVAPERLALEEEEFPTLSSATPEGQGRARRRRRCALRS